MQNFNFLSQLAQVELPEEALKSAKSPKNNGASRVPAVGADFRLKVNGLLTPSEELITGWDLAFASKSHPLQGSGIDFIPATKWVQYQQLIDGARAMNPNLQVDYPLFVAQVPRKISGKKTPQISAFANVSYNDDNTPKNTVDKTGATSLELVEYVLTHLFGQDCEPENYFNELEFQGASREDIQEAKREAYTLAKETKVKALAGQFFVGGFVDLIINTDAPFQIRGNRYHIPKKVTRGDNKGKYGTVVRESIILFPLSLFEATAESNPTGGAQAESTPAPVENTPQSQVDAPVPSEPVQESPVEETVAVEEKPVVDPAQTTPPMSPLLQEALDAQNSIKPDQPEQESAQPAWLNDALDINQSTEIEESTAPSPAASKFANAFARK